MNLLAFDTATMRASIALYAGGQFFHVDNTTVPQHAAVILPLIHTLLEKAGITISSLNGIVVGQGPGSFTGVRLACSIAKGLSVAYNTPIYPVSTLKTIALASAKNNPLSTEESGILVMLDARMKEVYWACYPNHSLAGEGKMLETVSPPALVQVPAGKWRLAGVGYEAYTSQWSLQLSQNIITEEQVYPDACVMIEEVLTGKIVAISALELAPVYVRQEVVWGKKHG